MNPDDATFTIEDLRAWSEPGTFLAVLGYPVRHSLSPPMHNRALRRMTASDVRFADWKYVRFELPPEQLRDALPLFLEKGFRGLNLTIPHKVDVLDMIEDVDAEAASMGAVNTLVAGAEGFRGFNTDAFGIARAVEDAFGRGLEGRDIVMLGAGGAARAVGVACLRSGCARLRVVNRTESRLRELVNRLRESTGAGDRLAARLPDELSAEGLGAALVINVTSLGLKPEDPAPLNPDLLGDGVEVFDSTYGCQNALARAAAARGVPYSDGLPMLVWQGVRSLEIWSGARVPAEEMFTAAREKLAIRPPS